MLARLREQAAHTTQSSWGKFSCMPHMHCFCTAEPSGWRPAATACARPTRGAHAKRGPQKTWNKLRIRAKAGVYFPADDPLCGHLL